MDDLLRVRRRKPEDRKPVGRAAALRAHPSSSPKRLQLQVAQAVGISPRYANSVLNEYHDTSVARLLQTRRRRFRKAFGVLPSQCRRLQAGGRPNVA
jgi:AraC-like DNA-binding protein